MFPVPQVAWSQHLAGQKRPLISHVGAMMVDFEQLLDRLDELDKRGKDRLGEWRIEKEPHDYPDGTTHFTHVRATGYVKGELVTVSISSYATPDTVELLVLMRNNLPELIRLARTGLKVQE